MTDAPLDAQGAVWPRKERAARKPTIYEAMKAKLGREPTNAELKAEVQRILRR